MLVAMFQTTWITANMADTPNIRLAAVVPTVDDTANIRARIRMDFW